MERNPDCAHKEINHCGYFHCSCSDVASCLISYEHSKTRPAYPDGSAAPPSVGPPISYGPGDGHG